MWAHAMRRGIPWIVGVAGLLSGSGCGGSASGGPPGSAPAEPGSQCEGQAFASTFAALEEVIFARHGCTEAVCHGAAAAGNLDLRPGSAYRNLVEVPSSGSELLRVARGDKDRSFLWRKLAAKVAPGSVSITGAPMPNGLPAIGANELEALRLWIYAGAPENGVVIGTDQLLDACLPDPEPLSIEPLEPPAPGEGLQFALPPVALPAASEQEICFAFYYDVSDRVPPETRDPTGEYFRVRGETVRQDPESHHIALLYSGVDVDDIHAPEFGAWTCHGGARTGEPCEPSDPSSCPGSVCRSEIQRDAVGCVGFGPPTIGNDIVQQSMGGAQKPQADLQFPAGVFAQYPLRGIAYWNSHAFNLTSKDHALQGRLNFYFAEHQDRPMRAFPVDLVNIFRPNAAPFTAETICADKELPQGTRLFALTSHTHKRGKHFWAELSDGTKIYENFLYNDPVKAIFDPPLAFDSPDAAERTIHYCATYENGIGPGGAPDPEAVTRASRIPASALATVGACTPVACVAGRIGAPCNGVGDDAACDSETGGADGWCDACSITGGESTENEMFLLIGHYYIADGYPQPPAEGPVFAGIA